MHLILPTYDQWILLFVGGTMVIMAANLIQWVIRRERVYALYSLYIFLWVIAFGGDALALEPAIMAFVRTVPFYVFSVLYLELALTFMNLTSYPRLLRWYRIMQVTWLLFALPETYFNLFSSLWQTGWHAIVLDIERGIVLVLTNLTILYTFIMYLKRTDVLARFFFVGTVALWLGEIFSTVVLNQYIDQGIEVVVRLPLPRHPAFIMQVGILLDLICVSLGLSYRQRQQALQQIMAEQTLIREREQYLRRQLEADLTVQQLKQQFTEAQMRALQSQVNPHFLFNSLNTLSALIDENPQQATDYVDELSSVYRYLLRAGDSELTSLSVELNFIRSYLHLLKTRYGQSICTEIAVADTFQDALLPPLTLQLLVENAVKHNRALLEEPLTIRIGTTEVGHLVVENNIQRRAVRVESNGVGLSNITDKYRLLNHPTPRIEEANGWFRVTLPLLLTSPATVQEVDME
ncbi:7TM protein involved in diverse intracellular signaling [Larkinella arboricola]|uniref:7TM protein involved in diverse intracellular signaling n=1 Tax=Larkinella arboricola TaxID=643671 RepID=A0A327WVW3_LARAB|nr:histidine kinase [Larkinella arboricola]RAJ97461.1 7TM protein involved in diverse intracellular signaling [Larkinella arboricola]